jgi:type IV secretion system protein VirD4
MTTDRSFPRGLPQHSKIAPTATASWHDPAALEGDAAQGGPFAYRQGRIWLGRSTAGRGVPVGWQDDKHMVTIAGSRSGKGVSAIIPALCDYPGSVICIDPKGENAFHTAARRGFGTSSIEGLHQDVYVLDPYGVSGVAHEYQATFDPLAGLTEDGDDALEVSVVE